MTKLFRAIFKSAPRATWILFLAAALTCFLVATTLAVPTLLMAWCRERAEAKSLDATLIVTAQDTPDEALILLSPLAETPGVARAVGVLYLSAACPDGTCVTLFGISPAAVPALCTGAPSDTPDLACLPEDGAVLSRSLASTLGLSVGDEWALLGEREGETYTVYAILPDTCPPFSADRSTVLISDTRAALRCLGYAVSGLSNRVYVTLDGTVAPQEFIDGLRRDPAYAEKSFVPAYSEEEVALTYRQLSTPLVTTGVMMTLVMVLFLILLSSLGADSTREWLTKLLLLGAERRQTFPPLLLRAFAVGTLGGAVGTCLFALLARVLTRVFLPGAAVSMPAAAWAAPLLAAGVLTGAEAARSVRFYLRARSFSALRREAEPLRTPLPAAAPLSLLAVLAITSAVSLIPGLHAPFATIPALPALLMLAAWLAPALLSVLSARLSRRTKAVSPRLARQHRGIARAVSLWVLLQLTAFALLQPVLSPAASLRHRIAALERSVEHSLIVPAASAEDVGAAEERLADTGVTAVTPVGYYEDATLATARETRTVSVFAPPPSLLSAGFFEITPTVGDCTAALSEPDTVLLDESYRVLDRYRVGDTVTLTLAGRTRTLRIGGFLSSPLASGQLVLVSPAALTACFGLPEANCLLLSCEDAAARTLPRASVALHGMGGGVLPLSFAVRELTLTTRFLSSFSTVVSYIGVGVIVLLGVVTLLLLRRSLRPDFRKLGLLGISRRHALAVRLGIAASVALPAGLCFLSGAPLLMALLLRGCACLHLWAPFAYDLPLSLAVFAGGAALAALVLAPPPRADSVSAPHPSE